MSTRRRQFLPGGYVSRRGVVLAAYIVWPERGILPLRTQGGVDSIHPPEIKEKEKYILRSRAGTRRDRKYIEC